MNITELIETAIIHQIAYHAASKINQAREMDFITFFFDDIYCSFSVPLDLEIFEAYKKDVFNIPIRDLISAQAIDKIYLDIDKEPELRLKNIDALVAMIKWHYKEFTHAKRAI